MNKHVCAPKKYDAKNDTCFSIEQLVEMAKAYNRYISKVKLSPDSDELAAADLDLIKIKADKKYLLSELKKRFNTVCQGNEVCLTKQEFMNEIIGEMREELENYTFRPTGPFDSTDWLSTLDINKIMKQYEKIYPDFKFLGAVPLNCDELNFCSLYDLDFDKFVNQKINKLGIIFNHDKYGQTRSH